MYNWHSKTYVSAVSSAEGARAAVVGLHAASGEAASIPIRQEITQNSFFSFYLAQKLCFWTGIIFIRVYVSVCVSVCV